MRLLAIPVVMIALLTSGCASSARDEPPLDVQGVIYETEPGGPFCFDPCYSTKLTVANDGRVWVEQEHREGRIRRIVRQQVQVPAETVLLFHARVDLYRPQGDLILYHDPECEDFIEDVGAVHISWQDEQGRDRLVYSWACDWQTTRRGMYEALRTAPALLNIPGLHLPELDGGSP